MISSDSGKESFIICRNSQGSVVRATVLRKTRHTVTFEVYNPYSILQNSEVLSDFKIFVGERLVYNGKAVVSGIVNTGLLLICEVSLGESWLDIDIFSPFGPQKNIRSEFEDFLKGWERTQAVITDFKVMIADIQMFLTDLRRWLEQVEFSIHSDPKADQSRVEKEVLKDLEDIIWQRSEKLFYRFEGVTLGIEESLQPVHRFYAKQQLHPLVLCAPFFYRTFLKPLGYAGDYEMVNMMFREPYEGASMFAKMLNYIFLCTPPVVAHRNRIDYLFEVLQSETLERIKNNNNKVRFLNLGCGPAQEIQRFLIKSEFCNNAQFTLLDFNDETLEYTYKLLESLKTQYNRSTSIKTIKKSVHQILKESLQKEDTDQVYDVIYCAGLFDYLSDRVCKRLMGVFYELLAPNGVLVATNVDVSNPNRGWMEYVVEWYLIYRNKEQFINLAPEKAQRQDISVKTDPSGVNIYLEVRKTPNV